ncbi:hypothetical protein [Thioflavicoccus mobilis]|nr:hypothetical protein [Thioflavicoccus mobilis]
MRDIPWPGQGKTGANLFTGWSPPRRTPKPRHFPEDIILIPPGKTLT